MNRSVQTSPTVIERLFHAVHQGDAERVLALLHPRIEWTPTVWSGEAMYRGEEGVHLWLSQFGDDLRHLDIRVQKAECRGDRGAVLGIVFDTRGDRTFAVEVAWSYEMEEGLLRRGRAHDSWDEALEAVGLAEAADRPSRLMRFRQALRPNPDCPVSRHLRRFSRR